VWRPLHDAYDVQELLALFRGVGDQCLNYGASANHVNQIHPAFVLRDLRDKFLLTMFPSLLRSLPRLGRTWKPLNFSNPNFVRVPASHKIEEETIPGYTASRYYPTRIGEIFKDRYQIVGKLGFGTSATVWLARDMK
jgi:hypothetical protein